MLGLTSRFIGSAPTDDAIPTDVGRYYPLTPEPPHHAVHAYLVNLQPEWLVVRRSWMTTANGGHLPPEILDGYYTVADHTPSFVIYRRSERPIAPHRRALTGFLENIAHPAYADTISINHAPLAPEAAAAAVPSLWHGGHHEIAAAPAWRLRIEARDAAPVHEVYLEGGAPTQDVRIEVRLRGGAGRPVKRLQHTVARGNRLRVQHLLDDPHHTEDIEITVTSLNGDAARLPLVALRVMAQSDELRDHVVSHGVADANDPPAEGGSSPR
jgi:hypothetical protein